MVTENHCYAKCSGHMQFGGVGEPLNDDLDDPLNRNLDHFLHFNLDNLFKYLHCWPDLNTVQLGR